MLIVRRCYVPAGSLNASPTAALTSRPFAGWARSGNVRWVNPRKEKKRKRKLREAGAAPDEHRRDGVRHRQNESDDSDGGALERRYERKQQRVAPEPEPEEPAVSHRLPIKQGKRLIVQPAAPEPRAAAEPEPGSDSEPEPDVGPGTGSRSGCGSRPEPEPEPAVPVGLEGRKAEIAGLATAVLEDPERSLSKLRELRELCSCRDPDIGGKVTKLAMVSLCSVFQDIIPGYRLREHTEKEKSAQVSAEVQQLRDFEESLLKNYQMYLQRLHAITKAYDEQSSKAKAGAGAKARRSLMQVAMRCMCTLLVEVPHFNFRSNIILLVVPRMNDARNEDIAQHCCNTVERLFQHDVDFDASQETVKAMARVIKAGNYRGRPQIVQAFLRLKLNESLLREARGIVAPAQAARPGKKQRKHISRMGRKERAAAKELDKDLIDAQAEVNKKAFARRQTETLNHVFATYFRVLKNARQSPLLPAVLQGLSKHAHLIDAAFFGDLMKVRGTSEAAQPPGYAVPWLCLAALVCPPTHSFRTLGFARR